MSGFLACCLAVVPVLSSVSVSPSCNRVCAVIACWPMHAMCKAGNYRTLNDLKFTIYQVVVVFLLQLRYSYVSLCTKLPCKHHQLIWLICKTKGKFQHGFHQAMTNRDKTSRKPTRIVDPTKVLKRTVSLNFLLLPLSFQRTIMGYYSHS